MYNAIYTIEEIDAIAKELLNNYREYSVWIFDGNMGAGKTTLIAALCKRLNSDINVQSPTFSIINSYVTKMGDTVHHMDWYRLNDVEEAVNAGVEDALYNSKFCFVEWPEKAFQLLPFPCVEIKLTVVNEFVRKLETKVLENDSIFL